MTIFLELLVDSWIIGTIVYWHLSDEMLYGFSQFADYSKME